MKVSDLFRFSTDNLRRRKGRTVLTVVGVVVGVCAIVVMVSLGIAVNVATDTMLQNWGDLTKISVLSYNAQQGTPDLDDDMVAQFQAIPHVTAATPLYRPELNGIMYAGRNERYEGYMMGMYGINTDAIEAMGFTLVGGQMLSNQPAGKEKIPVLIEQQAFFSFADTKKGFNNPDRNKYPQYDDTYTTLLNAPKYDASGKLTNPEEFFVDMLNDEITVRFTYEWDDNGNPSKYKDYILDVVGIVSAPSGDYQTMGGILMSLDNAKRIEKEYQKLSGQKGSSGGGMMYFGGMEGDGNTIQVKGYETVYVKVDDVKNMAEVEKTIKDIGYYFYSMTQERAQMQGNVAQTQMMMGSLAAVSLFVAALNIANTMTMAIYERTKEIGVMKVLGCNLGNIREMFLIESGFIGLLGGVIGVVLSLLISLVLNNLPQFLASIGVESGFNLAEIFGLGYMGEMMPDMKLSIIPPWLILLALGFATLVGLLSGIAPANRAVKISSLEAIRHE